MRPDLFCLAYAKNSSLRVKGSGDPAAASAACSAGLSGIRRAGTCGSRSVIASWTPFSGRGAPDFVGTWRAFKRCWASRAPHCSDQLPPEDLLVQSSSQPAASCVSRAKVALARRSESSLLRGSGPVLSVCAKIIARRVGSPDSTPSAMAPRQAIASRRTKLRPNSKRAPGTSRQRK